MNSLLKQNLIMICTCFLFLLANHSFAEKIPSMPSFVDEEKRFEDFLGREFDILCEIPQLNNEERKEYSDFIKPFILEPNRINFSEFFSDKNLLRSGFKLLIMAEAIKASGNKNAAVSFIQNLSKSIDQDLFLNAKKVYVVESLLTGRSLHDNKGLAKEIKHSVQLFLNEIGNHGTKSMGLKKLRGGEANIYMAIETINCEDEFYDLFQK